ncbi:MAG: nuclear transport factor 2 family protein [Gaiellaceae bacterium]
MTDVTALARWLNRYVGAWRSNDPARIGSLFTEDAVYRGHPYDEGESLAEGREAIVRGWLEEPDAPESWEMTFEPLAVSGELGIARCVTTYPGADGADCTYHNIFLVRLDDEGRCFDFTEYYMREPRADASD